MRWKHESPDAPVTLYSELDEERWEVRKVEVFIDGRMGFAEGRRESVGTALGDTPVPSLEEIAAIGEFEPATITRAEFERVWDSAVDADLDDAR